VAALHYQIPQRGFVHSKRHKSIAIRSDAVDELHDMSEHGLSVWEKELEWDEAGNKNIDE